MMASISSLSGQRLYNLSSRKVDIVNNGGKEVLRDWKSREWNIPASTHKDDTSSTLRCTIVPSLEDSKMHLIAVDSCQ